MSKIRNYGLILLLCAAFYLWGRSDSRACIIEQQAKEQQYVHVQTARIYARPNARRDTLLELMRRGKL